MKTIKYDEIYMFEYKMYFDVVEKLPNFIEEVYNKKRLYSSLNYVPPGEFEKTFARQTEMKYQNEVGRPLFKL